MTERAVIKLVEGKLPDNSLEREKEAGDEKKKRSDKNRGPKRDGRRWKRQENIYSCFLGTFLED